jgi:hypothetical protein
MVWIRWPDPDVGDQLQEMMPAEAADLIMDLKEKLPARFGVWEADNAQLELEMVNKTDLLEVLKEREGQTLRLVPVIEGG